MCLSTHSKRFKLTYYAYMIAGIHPLLNHAITHCEIQHDLTHVYIAYIIIDQHILLKSISEKHHYAYMIAGIHPLLNHTVTQIVKFNMIHSYMLMCPSTNSKRFKLTYYAYMIAGIHPLLNHAVTHYEV